MDKGLGKCRLILATDENVYNTVPRFGKNPGFTAPLAGSFFGEKNLTRLISGFDFSSAKKVFLGVTASCLRKNFGQTKRAAKKMARSPGLYKATAPQFGLL